VSKYLQAFLARQPECQLPIAPKGDDRSPAGAIGTNDTNGNWRGTATDFGADIERAAIIEHCAGLPADVADRHAREGWNTDDWRRWHGGLVARYLVTDTPAGAQARAYGAAISEWHARHGTQPDPGDCAGCGKVLAPGPAVLAPPGGAGVHGMTCLIAYGQQWRSAAVAGLAELGIAAPSGWTP